MSQNNDPDQDKLIEATREKLKTLSKALLRLHKILLDDAKVLYEKQNGPISSPNQFLALVLDDPHFSWLRKLSALIAQVDEAASVRRESTQTDALAYLATAATILNFEDPDEDFNDRFQIALQNEKQAVFAHNETMKILSAQ